jgi:hypothetical protein
MTFYEVWPSIKTGSVASRPIDGDVVYIKFENNLIMKKYDSNSQWVQRNLNDDDVHVDTWTLV